MRTHGKTFTLLEIVVAAALFAVVSAIVGAAMAGFQKSYDQISRLAQRLERNRALDRIAEHLGNAIPFAWPNADEDDAEQLVFDGKNDELWFTARARAGADGKGALRFFRLYLDEDKLQCDTRDLPLLPWLAPGEQPCRTETIADNVERLTFAYADYDDDDEVEWLDEWDQDDADYENRLPPAIRMTVEFRNGESVTNLRRTAGIAAFSGLAIP